jgi:plasmid stability protein
VQNRNITFSLPSYLIKQAKVYAAEHDTTVNALVRELLQERLSEKELSERERIRAAGKRILELARSGLLQTSVDPGTIRREEIYEERFKRW